MTLTDHDILTLLPRAPGKRSTSELFTRLAAAGHRITVRSLQRRLLSLLNSHPAITCDDRNKPFGWSISQKTPSNLGEMSVQEAVALKLSERYLKDALPIDSLDDLKHYFTQADLKLKHESLYRAWLDKVRIVPAHQLLAQPKVARNLMALIYDGVLTGKVLDVTYAARNAAKQSSYAIEPLALVIRGNVTYLLALFPNKDDITRMPLHRFKSVNVTDTPIRTAHDFNLDDYIASGAMGFMQKAAVKVRIRFFNGAGGHLVETPISLEQQLRSPREGEHLLTITLPITEQFKWWLLAFGDNAEILAPLSLRNEFKTRLARASQRYR